MTRRLVALVIAAGALAAPTARAAGDPASKLLSSRDVFLPHATKISRPLSARLAAAVRLADTRGAPAKVALVASPSDLGSSGSLYGNPSAYARFLDGKLRAGFPGYLVVVMPQGAAVARNGSLLPLRALRVGAGGDGLATAALAIVRKLTPAPPPRSVAQPRSAAPTRSSSPVDERAAAAELAAELPRPRPDRGTWSGSERLAVAVAVAVPTAIAAIGLLLVAWRRRLRRA